MAYGAAQPVHQAKAGYLPASAVGHFPGQLRALCGAQLSLEILEQPFPSHWKAPLSAVDPQPTLSPTWAAPLTTRSPEDVISKRS